MRVTEDGVFARPRARGTRSGTLPAAAYLVLCALAAGGCRPGSASTKRLPSPPPSVDAAAPPPIPTATHAGVPVDARAPDSVVGDFVGARADAACKAQTVEIAAYQQRGDVSLASRPGAVAATWRVRLGNKPDNQVAFAAFDEEARSLGRARGVGQTRVDVPPGSFPRETTGR